MASSSSSALPSQPAAFSLSAQAVVCGPAREVQRALKGLSSVQLTVQRTMAQNHDLEERFNAAQQRADESQASYLEDTAEEPDPERLRQVRAEQRSALLIADKKVQIVSEAHDSVDRQIERLDAAITQFQDEFGSLDQLGAYTTVGRGGACGGGAAAVATAAAASSSSSAAASGYFRQERLSEKPKKGRGQLRAHKRYGG